jgi:hypothetical protein
MKSLAERIQARISTLDGEHEYGKARELEQVLKMVEADREAKLKKIEEWIDFWESERTIKTDQLLAILKDDALLIGKKESEKE